MIKNNSIHPDAQAHLFDGPIPGQSLTNSPDQKYPWEQAPELTSQKETTQKIFLDLLKEDNLETVTTLMSDGVPIMDISQMLLMTAFQKGKMNPDMMISQLEPTTYILLAIAEKAGIKPILNKDDETETVEDEETDFEDLQTSQQLKNIVTPTGKFKDAKINKVNPASIGNDIKVELDDLDISKVKESILQKRKQQSSLLGKQE
tara:strand:- start:1347 stop:1958 length:612 start_codon:yes stop_codon:yes gene_type:complete